ncbi:peptidyl-prolyl cis-trans isomerase [Robiginitalea sp.]|uniref:peptidylprolyl isomerase n=1 Tax=Robiginitalea sp. TaxID=1902411 RepID=UPI003C78829C
MTDRLKNPIIQVVLLGLFICAALLLIFGPKRPSDSDRVIVIDETDMAQLIAGWQRTWNRMPTREELKGLMENHVREEVLYQEALNEGLDRNSAVVKRALITQMDMLAEGQGEQPEITEEALEAYYNLRKDQFISPAVISFKQVYFKEDQDSERLTALKDDWNQKDMDYETARLAGANTMLTPGMKDMPEDLIDREFGENFASKLQELTPGQWSGPVPSVFGWHLIYIDSLTPPLSLPLEAVRNEILMQLQYEDKDAAKEQFYTELLQQYEITYQGLAKQLVNE